MTFGTIDGRVASFRWVKRNPIQSPHAADVLRGPAAEANAFTNSVKFDTRLAHHDIAGSIAHARMLHHVGLLKKREMEAIVDGLESIGGEIAEGQFDGGRSWRMCT